MSKRSKDKFFSLSCGDFDMVDSHGNISIWYDTIPFLFLSLRGDIDCEQYDLFIHSLYNDEDLHIVGVDDV